MNPQDIVQTAIHRARVMVESIRRQAPGARMVGEFAVRFAARDVARRLRGAGHAEVGEDRQAGVKPTDSGGGIGTNGE